MIFVSSSEEYLAFTLILKHWKHIQGFIFLSEELRKKPEKFKTFTIAHELAHQKLRHLSPFFFNFTIEQVDVQEQAADDLALKWLSSEYKTEWDDSLKLRLERKRQLNGS